MTPERRRQIEGVDLFVCVVTDGYLQNPNFREDVALARELKKPIVAMVRRGTQVPPGTFEGVHRVVSWSTQLELKRAIELVENEISQGGKFNIERILGPLPRNGEGPSLS